MQPGKPQQNAYVERFNHHRLLEPIGYIPPAEAELNCYRQQTGQAVHA
ncbi:MAG: hypothetical protein LBM56_02305 [Burkholderiaceae bacterium]|nr:hypothetical protein [Burkholderiaceae bacterium]